MKKFTYVVSTCSKNVGHLTEILMMFYGLGVDVKDVFFAVSIDSTKSVIGLPENLRKHCILTGVNSFEYTGLHAMADYMSSVTLPFTDKIIHDNLVFLPDTVRITQKTIEALNSLDLEKNYLLSKAFPSYGVMCIRKTDVRGISVMLNTLRNSRTDFDGLYHAKLKTKSMGFVFFDSFEIMTDKEPICPADQIVDMFGKKRRHFYYDEIGLSKFTSNYISGEPLKI